MVTDKNMETMLKTEQKSESEELVKFIESLDENQKKELSNFLKGIEFAQKFGKTA